MDDEEKFTNRHGHTISALQEAVNNLPEPEHKLNVPVQPMRRKRRKFHLSSLQKRVLIIIVAVILIVPFLVGEYVRGAYAGDVNSARGSISKLFAATLTQQKNPVTSKSLTDIDNQLSAIRDGLCPGEFLDNLAKLYPRAQQAYDDCAAYRSNVAALESQISGAAAQMAYLEQLQPLLTGVSKPLEDQFAVLSAQQENWQSFVDGLNRLSVPVTFTAAHGELVTQASAVRDQWIALVQASNVQDSAAFRQARTKLTESFTAFHAQTVQFSSVVNDTQASITKAVAVLK